MEIEQILESRVEKPRVKALFMVGGRAEDRLEFCRSNLDVAYEIISWTSDGSSEAGRRFTQCLEERRPCALDGDFDSVAKRTRLVMAARDAGIRVVAFDFTRVADGAFDEGERPTLEEGFDEINRVRRIDGKLKFRLLMERCPLREVRTDENGNRVLVETDEYMVERPGGMGCVLSRGAFDK